MLTIPVQSPLPPHAAAPDTSAVLVIGRSENVLREAVQLLRAAGHAAGASNDYESVLTVFPPRALAIVVFGGMVPPDTKEALRTKLRAANSEIEFIQGLAGIPGLIAAQVQAAVAPHDDDPAGIGYDSDARVVELSLAVPQTVRVDGFWGTFVPPEPTSTAEELISQRLQAGGHRLPLPAWFPNVGSFIAVQVGPLVRTFTVGPMPRLDILPPPA
jgi:hypothetical protein